MKHTQAEQILREYLNKGNHRITPERFEVLNSALNYEGHFGADDLFILMKNKKSRVSRATVYNTLELLVKCDLLSKRNFGDNITRYESSFKRKSHDHLICMDCGRIVEFSSEELEKIPAQLCNELGFIFENYSFNIFARCKNVTNCKYYNKK